MNRIDLVSYPSLWVASAAIGEAAPLGFRAIYPRFMTLKVLIVKPINKLLPY
jgi:hypothetical protein